MSKVLKYEQYVKENYEVNEGVFTFDVKDIEKGLEKNNIEDTFKRAFSEAFKMGAIKKIADKTDIEKKKEILEQASKDKKIGTLRIKENELVYVPFEKVNLKGGIDVS